MSKWKNKWFVLSSILVVLIGAVWIISRQIYYNEQLSYNKVEIDTEGAYIKFTSSWWDEDEFDTELLEHLITSTFYTYQRYHEKNPTKISDSEEYAISKEAFTRLMEYIINEKHFFDNIESGESSPGIRYTLEVFHKGNTKKIILPSQEFVDELNIRIGTIKPGN